MHRHSYINTLQTIFMQISPEQSLANKWYTIIKEKCDWNINKLNIELITSKMPQTIIKMCYTKLYLRKPNEKKNIYKNVSPIIKATKISNQWNLYEFLKRLCCSFHTIKTTQVTLSWKNYTFERVFYYRIIEKETNLYYYEIHKMI